MCVQKDECYVKLAEADTIRNWPHFFFFFYKFSMQFGLSYSRCKGFALPSEVFSLRYDSGRVIYLYTFSTHCTCFSSNI